MNKEFSRRNRNRCESPTGFNQSLFGDKSWSASDWFTAVMGELGEAANIQKKLNRIRDGIPGNKETEDQLRNKLGKELADIYIYLDLLCQSQNIDLLDCVEKVFDEKSEQIGYKYESPLCIYCKKAEVTNAEDCCVSCHFDRMT